MILANDSKAILQDTDMSLTQVNKFEIFVKAQADFIEQTSKGSYKNKSVKTPSFLEILWFLSFAFVSSGVRYHHPCHVDFRIPKIKAQNLSGPHCP